MLLAPLVRDRKGEHQKLLAGAKQGGFVRVRVDGELRDLDEEIDARQEVQAHASRSWSTAWSCAGPMTTATARPDAHAGWPTRSRPRCASSDGNAPRPPARCAEEGAGPALQRAVRLPGARRLASRSWRRATSRFNSPHGACPDCTGLGTRLEIDPDLVIRRTESCRWPRARSLPWRADGGHRVAGSRRSWRRWRAATASGIDTPVRELTRGRAQDRAATATAASGSTVQVPARATAASHTFRTTFEGVVPNLRAALPGDRLRGDARPRSSAT